MARTIIVHFYCLRHGNTDVKFIDLDRQGYDQVNATRETHLAGVHFRFAACSDAQRAMTSLTLALGPNAQSVPTYKKQDELGYTWLLNDPRLPVPIMRKRRAPKNAFDYIAVRPQSLLLGHVMWEHLQALAKAELWISFHGKAMTRQDEERVIECNALIAGHGGAIEAMAAVRANQTVALVNVPMLKHGDILRYTAQWTVDNWSIGEPSITAIDHLPCPIKS